MKKQNLSRYHLKQQKVESNRTKKDTMKKQTKNASLLILIVLMRKDTTRDGRPLYDDKKINFNVLYTK